MDPAELVNLRRARDLLDREYARPPVFVRVDDVDRVFESLRAAGVEVLQEPIDEPYGVRDCAVRDPSGNHLRLSQPLAT